MSGQHTNSSLESDDSHELDESSESDHDLSISEYAPLLESMCSVMERWLREIPDNDITAPVIADIARLAHETAILITKLSNMDPADTFSKAAFTKAAYAILSINFNHIEQRVLSESHAYAQPAYQPRR